MRMDKRLSASPLTPPTTLPLDGVGPAQTQWRFYVWGQGAKPPKSCPGPKFLIGSVVISLSRCCHPKKYFFSRTPTAQTHVIDLRSTRHGPPLANSRSDPVTVFPVPWYTDFFDITIVHCYGRKCDGMLGIFVGTCFVWNIDIQGAANKSNPLPCFVNISTTNRNFYTKIYPIIHHLYLRIAAELY